MAEETITQAALLAEVCAERDQATMRAEAADAKLAAIHQAVVDGLLAEYGTSTLATFKAAVDLAWQVREILAGSGVAAREAIAGAERERLLDLAGSRLKVVMIRPGGSVRAEAVPWTALRDVLRGLPSAGLGEAPDDAGHGQSPAGTAAVPGPQILPAALAAGPRERLGRAAHAVYCLWWGEQPQPKVPFYSWDGVNQEWRDLMMRIGEAAAGAERDRILDALAVLRVPFPGPGSRRRKPVSVDVVPWEGVVRLLARIEDGTQEGGPGVV